MFDQEQQQIIASLKDSEAAQSWLVIGPSGVGKKEFAKMLSQHLTQQESAYNSSVKWIQCGLTDAAKSEIQKMLLAGKNLEEKNWSKKTHISVDDVREGCKFLSLKSDKIKILIFDLADDMNENAQNALLKTLEEPYPNTLILLLCENVGHLLPTVLSRCQKLYLSAISPATFKKEICQKYPTLSSQELDELSFLSGNVVGFAERIIKMDVLSLYHQLLGLLQDSSKAVNADILTFAEKVAKETEIYELVKEFILKQIAFSARQKTRQNLAKAYEQSALYMKVLSLFYQVEAINLDKKQTLVNVLYEMKENL